MQREIAPRVSVDFGYFRRWFGNFAVTDNRALAASDFTPFSVTAPVDVASAGRRRQRDRRVRTTRTRSSPHDNYFTLGEQLRQPDSAVERRRSDRERADCAAACCCRAGSAPGARSPTTARFWRSCLNSVRSALPYCHQTTDFLTQLKFFGSYTVPTRRRRTSAAPSRAFPVRSWRRIRSSPLPAVQPSLGRDLIGGAANVTVNLVPPGTLFGDRLNQLDIRVAKLLKTGRHADVAEPRPLQPVQRQHGAGGELDVFECHGDRWRVPTTIVTARFAKISVQFDF